MVNRKNTNYLMEAVLGSDEEAIRDIVYAIGESKGKWSHFISNLFSAEVTEAAKEQFHTVWVELGWRIRSQVGDDKALARMLSALLPKYRGESIQLYRGESAERYGIGRIGFCWTPNIEMARTFARGLNAYFGDGGVLLATMANQSSIIAGPNDHSIHLGEHEYTLDPFSLSDIEVLKTYPPLPPDW